MGPWRPSSVPETCRPKKKKKVEKKPAFEFVPGGRGAQNVAASALGPRLGAQSSPAARRAAFARAASPDAEVPPSGRVGPEQAPARFKGRARFSPAAGPLLHHSARRRGCGDSKDDSSDVGFLDLVHEAAGAAKVAVAAGRDARRSLHIGRGARTAPVSPPRQLQPRCSLRWLSRQESPAPDRGGLRRKCAGRQRREGAGSRPRRTAAAPLAPLSLTPRSPGASAAPHCPAIFSAPHTRTPPPPSTTAAAAHGTRPAAAEASAHTARPRRRPAHTAGPAAGPSPSASPPSPGLHAPL